MTTIKSMILDNQSGLSVPWCFHKNDVPPKGYAGIAKTVHRTKSQICKHLNGIGEAGIQFECTDGFR